MKRTLPIDSDVPPRYGLGLGRHPAPCGKAWGHSGDLPRLPDLQALEREREASYGADDVDPSALPAGTLRQFNDLLYKAYCSTS